MSELLKEIIIEEKNRAAVRMLEKGKCTYEEIAEYLDLPLRVVEKLSEDIHANEEK